MVLGHVVCSWGGVGFFVLFLAGLTTWFGEWQSNYWAKKLGGVGGEGGRGLVGHLRVPFQSAMAILTDEEIQSAHILVTTQPKFLEKNCGVGGGGGGGEKWGLGGRGKIWGFKGRELCMCFLNRLAEYFYMVTGDWGWSHGNIWRGGVFRVLGQFFRHHITGHFCGHYFIDSPTEFGAIKIWDDTSNSCRHLISPNIRFNLGSTGYVC